MEKNPLGTGLHGHIKNLDGVVLYVLSVRRTLIGTLRDMEMISRKNDDTENDDIISTSYPPLPCLLIR